MSVGRIPFRLSEIGGQTVRAVDSRDLHRLLEVNLRRWACAGCGPRRLRLGGPVRYRRADLLRWLEERTVEPTRPGPRRRRQNTTRHQAAASLETAS